jgi:polysaccharide biosynthesis protein VpsM
MKTKNLQIAVTASLVAASTAAFAQSTSTYVRPAYQYPGPALESGPASVRMGDSAFFATPYLGLGAGYDDNLFSSDIIKKESPVFIVSPGIILDSRDANKVIQLRYQGQIGRYTDSSADNYVDHTARAQFDAAFDRRNFMRVGLDYLHGHDPRGSTDRPPSERPDKYELLSPQFTYAFGAPGAMGRLEAYYNYGHKKYTNNRHVTQFSDRNTSEAGGVFYWRIMPRTYVLAEARFTDIRYRHPASSLSAEETRIYAGVTWEATAATTGTVKIGRLERDFDRPNLQDFDDTSWEALITWAPRTYSKFDLYSARQTNESTGLGNFIVTSLTGVTWTHNWSSVLSTGLDARYQKDQYQGFDRTDDLNILGLRVGYKFRRWLTLGAEYSYTKRESNRSVFDYDRNFYLLTATMSM